MLNLQINEETMRRIVDHEQTEIYRDIKQYWSRRFITEGLLDEDRKPTKQIGEILLTNGPGPEAPQLAAKVAVSVGRGREEWGADPGAKCYRIELLKFRWVRR